MRMAKFMVGGYMYFEMLFLKSIGIPLEKLPYALNETIRMWIRLLLPFLIIFGFSMLTSSKPCVNGTKFFLKMRIPVESGDREADAAKIAFAEQNPDSTKSILLFPKSNWEFYRWSPADHAGFAFSLLFILFVIALFCVAITVGS